MVRIYVMRHGETVWNKDGNRYCGRSDVALSELGRIQAEKAGAYLRNTAFDAIYASPLQRAIETARPTADAQSLAIQVDERITEIDFGLWDGNRDPVIRERYADNWDQWRHSPENTPAGIQGETGAQVFERMNRFFTEVTAAHTQGNILVVSHSTAIRLYIAGALSMPLSSYKQLVTDNTGISTLEPAEYGMRLLQLNYKCD